MYNIVETFSFHQFMGFAISTGCPTVELAPP